MHRFVIGTWSLQLTLTPHGPWLVRGQTDAERYTDGRGRPGSRDVLFPLRDEQGRPLLPASSLKGVLRSTAERILRTMQPADRAPSLAPFADDPFVHRGGMPAEDYARWLSKQPRAAIADSELPEWAKAQPTPPADLEPARVYRVLSAASQLFGATVHAGLLRLDDATAATTTTHRRSHVAIDRFTGGVGEGPFIEQLAPASIPLTTQVTVSNFALWQIGLLALTFRELSQGYGAVGGGTRKGHGQVTIAVSEVAFSYMEAAYDRSGGIVSAQARLADDQWCGTGMAHNVPAAVLAEREVTLLPDLAPQRAQDWRAAGTVRLAVPDAQVSELFRQAVRDAWMPWISRMGEEQPA